MEKSQPTTEGLRMMKLLLIAVVLGLATDASHGLETKSLHPILLVPGLHASRLEAKLDKPKVVKSICSKKSDWFTIWFNPLQLSPFSVDCWIDNFGMDFDEASGKPVNRAGVQIRAPDFGGTSSVENLNPIKGIIGESNPFSDSNFYIPTFGHRIHGQTGDCTREAGIQKRGNSSRGS